jgi:hypothetical protein
VWVVSEYRRHANPLAGEAERVGEIGNMRAVQLVCMLAGRMMRCVPPRLCASPARRVAIPRGVEVIGPLAARPLEGLGLASV